MLESVLLNMVDKSTGVTWSLQYNNNTSFYTLCSFRLIWMEWNALDRWMDGRITSEEGLKLKHIFLSFAVRWLWNVDGRMRMVKTETDWADWSDVVVVRKHQENEEEIWQTPKTIILKNNNNFGKNGPLLKMLWKFQKFSLKKTQKNEVIIFITLETNYGDGHRSSSSSSSAPHYWRTFFIRVYCN